MSISTEIAAPSWLTLLTRYGISKFGKWFLNDTVVPTVIVDSAVTLTASSVALLLGNPASAGELVAPAANTRLADSGPLPAGTYTFTIWLQCGDAAFNCRIRRRNSADAADIWSQRFSALAGGNVIGYFHSIAFRITLAANERVVIENVAAGTAAITYQASLWATAG